MALMNRLINELFLRMEGHVDKLTETTDYPLLLSDLKLFVLLAGDLAIQVEDFEKSSETIEVSEEEAVRMGLIAAKTDQPVVEPVASGDAKTGQYL